MLGRLLFGAIAAGMAWKYRDTLRDYMKHPDQLLDQLSSGISRMQERMQERTRADKGPANSLRTDSHDGA